MTLARLLPAAAALLAASRAAAHGIESGAVAPHVHADASPAWALAALAVVAVVAGVAVLRVRAGKRR